MTTFELFRDVLVVVKRTKPKTVQLLLKRDTLFVKNQIGEDIFVVPGRTTSQQVTSLEST